MKLKNPFVDNGCRCPNKHAITPEERELAWVGIRQAVRTEDLSTVLINAAMLLPCKTRQLQLEQEIEGYALMAAQIEETRKSCNTQYANTLSNTSKHVRLNTP